MACSRFYQSKIELKLSIVICYSLSMTPVDARMNHIAVARRSVLEDRGSLPSSHIDSWIERSWKRCLSKGFQPQTAVEFAQISRQDLHRVEIENHDLLCAAKPLMDKLGAL